MKRFRFVCGKISQFNYMACAGHKPKVILFDLDRTLWPFRVDKHCKSPFRKNNLNGEILDSTGTAFQCFPGIENILATLIDQKYELALVSRITDICGAYQLLEFFGLSLYFAYKDIYPGRKTTHVSLLLEKSGVQFSEMLFFDDMWQNVRDVGRLGVVAVQVPKCGITTEVVEDGLQAFHEQFCSLCIQNKKPKLRVFLTKK